MSNTGTKIMCESDQVSIMLKLYFEFLQMTITEKWYKMNFNIIF